LSSPAARKTRTKKKRTGRAWFFTPALVYFGLFLLVPILSIGVVAFTNWSGFSLSQARWNGLVNFRSLLNDHEFGASLVRTLIFVVFTTVGLNILGLALALIVDSRVRGHEFLRVAALVPLGVSPVIAGVIWQLLLGPLGLFDTVLHGLGMAQPFNFLGQQYAFPSILGVSLWQYVGFDMLLYYAGLQTLPADRVEAARVDGASSGPLIRHIVWPYLRPITGVAVALNLIGGWKVFDIVYVLTGGGPSNSTQVLSTYLYEQAFTFNNLGYASAIALVIMVLALVSVFGQRMLAGRHV
jgi:raffinose/stachyose/melibiose transport system permease protein